MVAANDRHVNTSRTIQRVMAASAIALALTSLARPHEVRAESKYSDQLCPRAAAPVTKFTALANNNDTTVVAAIDAANEAIAAYKICSSEFLANGATEFRHYADVRQAQFAYEIGHFQRLTDEKIAAKQSLASAIDLTKETIDWTSGAQNVYRSNGTSGSGSTHAGPARPSTYHDTAVAVRDAAQKELDEMAAPVVTASPSAGASKAP